MSSNNNVFPEDVYYDCVRVDQTPGLTKREYYAARALQGLLAANENIDSDIAKRAVWFADALTNELERTELMRELNQTSD